MPDASPFSDRSRWMWESCQATGRIRVTWWQWWESLAWGPAVTIPGWLWNDGWNDGWMVLDINLEVIPREVSRSFNPGSTFPVPPGRPLWGLQLQPDMLRNRWKYLTYHHWLVVRLPLWKIWVRQLGKISVGMMTFPINGKIILYKNHVPVTTNQISQSIQQLASPGSWHHLDTEEAACFLRCLEPTNIKLWSSKVGKTWHQMRAGMILNHPKVGEFHRFPWVFGLSNRVSNQKNQLTWAQASRRQARGKPGQGLMEVKAMEIHGFPPSEMILT